MKNRALLKATAIYTLTDSISKGISFIALPVISHYLIPEQLGIAANFDVLQSIMMLIAGQAIINGLPYFFYERTRREMAQLVSALLAVIFIVNIFFSVIILLGSGLLERYLHIGLSLQLLTFVSVVSFLITSIGLVLYRLEEKPYRFAIFQLGYILLYFPVMLWLVIECQMEAAGKIYGSVIALFAISIFHLITLSRRGYLTWRINRISFNTLLKFGVPLLPHSLSFWIKGGMDKILLTTFCGLTANGLYSMAMSFGAAYSIFNTAFSNAFIPYLQKRINAFTSANREQEKRRIVLISYRIGAGFIVLSVFVVAGCWLVINYMLSDKYIESFQFVPWIIASLTIYSFYGIVIQFPYTVKKTFGLGCITFSGSIIQCLLTYFLVSNIGIDGIKYSLVAGSLIIMAGVWWYSNKVYPMPWFGKHE